MGEKGRRGSKKLIVKKPILVYPPAPFDKYHYKKDHRCIAEKTEKRERERDRERQRQRQRERQRQRDRQRDRETDRVTIHASTYSE